MVKKKVKLPKNAAKWIRALRSGKYEQTVGGLRNGNKFCCLGVACDLAKTDLGLDWKDDSFDGRGGFLPDSVRQWLGFSVTAKDDGTFSESSLLVENDNGKSFKQIATIIEKHADELFAQEPA